MSESMNDTNDYYNGSDLDLPPDVSPQPSREMPLQLTPNSPPPIAMPHPVAGENAPQAPGVGMPLAVPGTRMPHPVRAEMANLNSRPNTVSVNSTPGSRVAALLHLLRSKVFGSR